MSIFIVLLCSPHPPGRACNGAGVAPLHWHSSNAQQGGHPSNGPCGVGKQSFGGESERGCWLTGRLRGRAHIGPPVLLGTCGHCRSLWERACSRWLCVGRICFDGVHIRFSGYGRYWFRPYGGSLGRAPSNQGLLPLTFGASLWLGIPSLRSCSVGPPPSAIHGRRRLTRHPCRVAHCAEPALGLTRGRVPPQRPRRPTGRPVCRGRSSVMYLVDWQAAIASKLAPTGTQYIRKISAGWQAAIASKLAPTGTQYIRKISAGWQAAIASKLAPTGTQYIRKISAGWQAAIASKLAPTEEQRQSGVHPCFSPLIRPSVSSPAALDLDPPAPSAG
ncbi:hypothetical protein EMIT0196MI5_330013 [Pseudomonas sp. IT-196MI5]